MLCYQYLNHCYAYDCVIPSCLGVIKIVYHADFGTYQIAKDYNNCITISLYFKSCYIQEGINATEKIGNSGYACVMIQKKCLYVGPSNGNIASVLHTPVTATDIIETAEHNSIQATCRNQYTLKCPSTDCGMYIHMYICNYMHAYVCIYVCMYVRGYK